MQILNFYADGSGHPDYREPLEHGDTDHYALAGLLVNDEQRQRIEGGCDSIILRYFPHFEPRSVEIKATWIIARQNLKPPWDSLPGPLHASFLDDVRDLLLLVQPVLLGQVVHKQAYRLAIHASRPERPANNALRFIMGRLDRHLVELGVRSRVTLDADSPAMQEAQRALEASVRTDGDRLSKGLVDPPVVSRFEGCLPFQHVNSERSRCLQLADVVAHLLWQAAEYGKARRLRELDPLWRRYGTKREPWTAYLAQERIALIQG